MVSRPNCRVRHAFTLIEMLTVIGIILILGGLLLVGMRSITNGGKANSTKVTLSALAGMFGELDAKTHLGSAPPFWEWVDTGGATPPEWSVALAAALVPPTQVDFWHIPYVSITDTKRAPDALDAPASVEESGQGASSDLSRNASRQVLNTELVMARILALPSNRAALEKLSASLYFTPEYRGGALPHPGMTDHVFYTSDDAGTEDIYYLAGMKVIYVNPDPNHPVKQTFRCVVNTPSITPGVPPATPNWVPDSSPATPLLLDAWNNPIIFVPGTGLRVRLLNGKSENDINDNGQTFIIMTPEGHVSRATPTDPPYVTQAGRPFFASAGPDGDFTRGDDNIYSFQQ